MAMKGMSSSLCSLARFVLLLEMEDLQRIRKAPLFNYSYVIIIIIKQREVKREPLLSFNIKINKKRAKIIIIKNGQKVTQDGKVTSSIKL